MVTRKPPKSTPVAPPQATHEFFTVLTGFNRHKPNTEPDDIADGQAFYCSFCGMGTLEVETMITAPDANICGHCVDLCRDIVGAHRVKVRMGDDSIIYEPKD